MLKHSSLLRTLTLGMAALLPAVIAAATSPNAKWFQPAFPEKPAIEVAPGESGAASDYLEFPALPPKEGMTPVLKIDARLLSPKSNGWNQYCAIEVNGKFLGQNTATGTPRLLGRSAVMETSHQKEKQVPYWKNGARPMLLMLFAPKDASDVDSRVISDRKMKYEYYLDVSDFASKLEIGADARVENDKPNQLRFFNLLPKRASDSPLYVQHVTIGYVPTKMLAKLSGVKYEEVENQNVLGQIAADGFKLSVLSSGALKLNVGKEVVGIDSAFSYVNKPDMKFNELKGSQAQATGEPQFGVAYRQIDEKSGELSIRASRYQITRTLTADGNKIRVKDRYQNISKSDLGIIWKNGLYFSGSFPSDGWRLSGRSNINHEGAFSSRNPTIYAKHHDAAVMMLLEDTIGRTLMESFAVGNTYTATTDGMGIAAGKEVTLEWSIYAGTGVDYWDFINQIRREWNVNWTVPGPYLFFSTADRPGLQLRLSTVHPWLDYSDGAALTREQYEAQVRPRIEAFRQKYPGIKLLGLVENNLINFDPAQMPWKDELPLTCGDRTNPQTRYAQYLSPELSRKLDAVTPFRDSILHDKDGNDMIDNYYIYNRNPFINLMVQPEIGNQRYQFFFNQIDFLMDQIGFDGVYIDQFNPTPRDGYSFDRWDGVSVRLNADGTIGSKFYNYMLTGAPARRKIIRYIVEEKHGMALTNGHPATREEQSSGRLSFSESENDSNCNPMLYLTEEPAEVTEEMWSHLATPVVLGIRTSRYLPKDSQGKDYRAQLIMKAMITALHNGVLYYYYSSDMPLVGPDAGSFEIANWTFPITPVKLGKGVIVGKERTLVAISGNYTVGGNRPPKIGYFNDHGILQDAGKFAVTGQPGAWTVAVRLNDWNEMAIIVVQD